MEGISEFAKVNIKLEEFDPDELENWEPCLICSTLLAPSTDESVSQLVPPCLKDSCQSVNEQLWAIFLLRRLLQISQLECEKLLKNTYGLNPKSWFRVCNACCEMVNKGFVIYTEILKLEKELDHVRQTLNEKLDESFNFEKESFPLRKTNDLVFTARTSIRISLSCKLGIGRSRSPPPPTKLCRKRDLDDSRKVDKVNMTNDSTINTDLTDPTNEPVNLDQLIKLEADLVNGDAECQLKKKASTGIRTSINQRLLKIRKLNRSFSKIKCNQCPNLQMFPCRISYKAHLMAMHQEKLKWKCDLCPKSYTRSSDLRFHRDSAHTGKRCICPYCRKVNKCHSYMERHLKQCEKRPKSHFPTTTSNFRKQSTSNRNIPPSKKATSDNSFILPHDDIVEAETTNNNNLKLRYIVKVTKVAKEDTICPSITASLKERHVCNECGLAFQTPTDLHLHTKRVHPSNEKFICVHCNKKFLNLSVYKKHEASCITNDGNDDCEPVKELSRVNPVIKVSHKMTSRKCQLCPHLDAFRNSSLYRTHIKDVHTNKYKFNCDMCDKSYTRSNDLKRHKGTSHTRHKSECPYCGVSKSCELYLNRHLGICTKKPKG